MSTIFPPRIFKSKPVDHKAIKDRHDRDRKAIFTFACYSPDLRFTLDAIVKELKIPRHTAWLRIHELIRDGLVKVVEGSNPERKLTYRVNATGEITEPRYYRRTGK